MLFTWKSVKMWHSPYTSYEIFHSSPKIYACQPKTKILTTPRIIRCETGHHLPQRKQHTKDKFPLFLHWITARFRRARFLKVALLLCSDGGVCFGEEDLSLSVEDVERMYCHWEEFGMFQNVRRLLRSVLLDVIDLETFLLSGLNGW